MFEALKGTRTTILPRDADYDVFGDGVATIMPAPGHTPDSSVLVVRLKRHRPVILVGDLYHFRKDIETGKIAPNEDAPALRASRAKVEALARKIGAEIWVAHDWNAFAKLRKSPAFYE
jgi:glyoxylase-like metal-dependent hydrolase (beta-lactamase superfamily II)